MKTRKIVRFLVLITVLATLTAIPTKASAASVTINFQELANEAGIQVGGNDINGNPISFTKLLAETFHLSSPQIPAGYPADATLSHIGISNSASYYLADLLESPGGDLSDQVFVHRLSNIFTVIDFISDPDEFVTDLQPTVTLVETGDLQNVLNYNNDRGELVSINVVSDVADSVPEPASLFLLGSGLMGMLAARKRRKDSLV